MAHVRLSIGSWLEKLSPRVRWLVISIFIYVLSVPIVAATTWLSGDDHDLLTAMVRAMEVGAIGIPILGVWMYWWHHARNSR